MSAHAYFASLGEKSDVGTPLRFVSDLLGYATRQCNVATSGFPPQMGFYQNAGYDPSNPDDAANFEWLYNGCATPTAGCCSNTFKVWMDVKGGSAGDYAYSYTLNATGWQELTEDTGKYFYFGRAGSNDSQATLQIRVDDNVTGEAVTSDEYVLTSTHIPLIGGP